MISEYTFHTTDGAIFSQFFGPRRLGPQDLLGGGPVEVDTPHTTPLVGNGSLGMRLLTASQAGHCYRTDSHQHGWTSGGLQSQFYVAAVNSFTGGYGFGFYCYAQAEDLTAGGAAYLAGCSNSLLSSDGYTFDVFLSRVVNGLPDYLTTARLLTRVRDSQWPLTTHFRLGLDWRLMAGGLMLTVSTSLALAGDLTPLFQYTDVSPLTMPQHEGIWIANGASTIFKAFADETVFRNDSL